MRRNRTVLRSRARLGRAIATSKMEGRDRAGSSAMKGLLGKQLADISDTLAKASARRDAEVKRRLTPKPQPNVAPDYSLRPPSTNPSLSSDAEATIGSESGRSVAFAGDDTQSTPRNLEHPYLDLPQTTAIMGEIIPTASLRGGYASNEDASKIMLAQFEKPNITVSALDDGDDDDDIESMLLQLERLKATHNPTGNNHLEDTAPQMGAPAEDDSPVFPRCGSDEEDEDDPTRLLAELASSSLLGQRAVPEETNRIDAEESLAKPKSAMSCASRIRAHDADDELTKMLAELEARAELRHHSGPMKIPTTVEEMPPAIQQSSATQEPEDIEALYNRLMGTRSSSPDLTPYDTERQNQDVSGRPSVLESNKEIIPYIVALQLELAGTQWESALGWTKYLFSTGLDGHQARCKKDEIVAQADKDLEKVIQQVLRDEEHYLGVEDRNKIPRRLIVSNLAAGATEEDLEAFFYSLRYVIQDIKVLPIRDPNKGTQVAHVDMLTRQDAVRASFTVGGIFGLIPKLELAEKRDK